MAGVADFIARYGIFSGIGVTVLLAAIAFIRRRARRMRSDGVLRPGPLDFELVPLWFEVSLYPPTPEVYVYLQAVNYLNRNLVLDEIKVSYFKVSSAPHVENITETEYAIPGRQSRQIRCRRRLIDSEIRAFMLLKWEDRFDASVHVSARGHAGRKTIKYVNTSYGMHGWIKGLPSRPRAEKEEVKKVP